MTTFALDRPTVRLSALDDKFTGQSHALAEWPDGFCIVYRHCGPIVEDPYARVTFVEKCERDRMRWFEGELVL